MTTDHRRPYVGTGADGARRSAAIDREEAHTLPTGPHQPGYSELTEARRSRLLASADRWEAQAAELDTVDPAAARLERLHRALAEQDAHHSAEDDARHRGYVRAAMLGALAPHVTDQAWDNAIEQAVDNARRIR